MKRLFRHREAVPGLLVILAFIAGVIESPHFLDVRYLFDATSLYAETGVLALGMTFVIVCGQIDLSVASTMALVACVAAKMLDAHLPAAVVLPGAIVLGGLLGAVNGLLVSKLRLPSFVVTLATMAAYRGLAQVLMKDSSVKLPDSLVGADYIRIPGTPIPLPFVVLIVLAVLSAFLLHKTVFGRWVTTVGTNEKASFYSGVPTARVTTMVFAITGALCGVAGLLIDSRLGVARFDDARGLEVDVITAVVLGGASIYGGEGSILGTMLALLLVAIIRIGMGLANVTPEYQFAVVGTLLVLAVAFGNVARRFTTARRPATMTLQAAGKAPESVP